MTNKQLLLLALVAAALVLVTALVYVGGRGPRRDFVPGTPLIQGLDPDTVDKIVIKSDAKTVTLWRQAAGGRDAFYVAERSDYPALVKKINELIVKCLEVRCAEKVTDDPKNHSAMGVDEKDTEAVTVSFLGADGEAIVGLVKGKSVESGSGYYVRLAGQDAVFRAEGYLSLNAQPTDYIERELLSVKKDDVLRVEVQPDTGDAYTIARDEADTATIKLLGIPDGMRAKGSDYEDAFNALSSLDLSDVSGAEEKGLTWDAMYVSHLTHGLSYSVNLAKKDGTHYVRLAAKGPQVGTMEISRTESDAELKRKEAILLAMDTAKTFEARHAPWVYEISSWTAGKMRKSFADLIEEIPKDTTPERITASHILIAYKGAGASEATRSKEDARTLANEVLAKAKAEGADFAALAREYSDGPSGAKGGDLEPFGKGKMAKAFEEAAFKLEVGEISEVVETPFGFHVIKRTEDKEPPETQPSTQPATQPAATQPATQPADGG